MLEVIEYRFPYSLWRRKLSACLWSTQTETGEKCKEEGVTERSSYGLSQLPFPSTCATCEEEVGELGMKE